ncbi:MAG: HAD family phosphatase [Kiritimatiellae bacterium]|nr:HAD family phosphatase [Kiritimatiellia bacterium]
MIKAIIFDLDGTIVDTEMLWADAMINYLKDQGYECSRASILEVVYGRSWSDIYCDLIARYPVLAATSVEEMAVILSVYHQQLRDSSDEVVIDSSVKVLKELAASYPVIVVSGSPRQDIIECLQIAGISSSVQFFLGAEDYAPGKPHPAGYLMGAAMLGVEPAECLVFEDSAAGVTAAKSAGMRCVALSRASAHKQDVSHADLVLCDLAAFDINDLQLNG